MLLWDVASGKVVATLAHDSLVNSVAISPDGKWLVSGDNGGIVTLWDVTTKTPVNLITFKGNEMQVSFVRGMDLQMAHHNSRSLRKLCAEWRKQMGG